MADIDLCLLPTTVELDFDLNDGDEISIKESPTNFATSLKISLPKAYIKTAADQEIIQKMESEIFGLALFILDKCSMLPEEKFRKALEKKLKDGLSNKTFIGMPYLECYREVIIPENEFENIDVQKHKPLNSDLEFHVTEANELGWNNLPGIGYSKSMAKKYLQSRYKKTIKPIKLTLQKANKNENFKKVLNSLKNEGFLDWQLLLIIMNTVLNYRSHQNGFKSIEIQTHLQKEMMSREELESDREIPIDLLSTRIAYHKDPTIGAIAKTWGLVIKQSTPDMNAIKELLDVKYGNSSDDIPHEVFF